MVYRNSLTHDDGDGKDLEAHEVEEALAEEAEDHSDGSDEDDDGDHEPRLPGDGFLDRRANTASPPSQGQYADEAAAANEAMAGVVEAAEAAEAPDAAAGISTAYSPSFYAEAPADADVEDEEEEIEEEETDDEVRGSGAGDPSSNTEQFARVARKQT